MQTKTVLTNLGRVHLRIVGTGPAMVCWPSLLMTGMMWEGQIKHFSSSYRMILVDPPGHGESDKLSRTFTLEECAECLREILEALNISDCVLLGNSWGGMMGGVFAALYPEKLRAAVLMNCTASEASASQKLAYADTINLLRKSDSYPESLLKQSVKAFVGKTTELNRQEVVDQVRKNISEVEPQSVSWAIESVVTLRKNQLVLMKKITLPILVVAGEEDRTFKIPETKEMAAAIPNAEFKVLAKVGHLAALEAPQLVNDEIELFLLRLGSAVS